MKKILLLSLLLGLSGCGDNNQSDTSQSNAQAQILQHAEVTPTEANYSLASSPRAMSAVAPLQGWSITNSKVMGASTLIDAIKDSKVSAALVTPNARQIAEVLRGGAAGIALNIAVDQLLDSVDWVMDPANNQIKYKEIDKPAIENPAIPRLWATVFDRNKFIHDSAETAGRAACQYKGQPYIRVQRYLPPGTAPTDALSAYIDCRKNDGTVDSWSVKSLKNPIYDPNANVYQTLPLEVVAEQVITNADAGSLDAQVATNIAVQNILNDAEQAEPVVQDLENNARNNCPSGITNNGSCWVCSRESWAPIRSRVVYAKEVVFGLNKCSVAMNSSQLLTRYKAYSELGAARDAENACWSPQDQEHVEEAIKAKATAAECNTYLGVLGQ